MRVKFTEARKCFDILKTFGDRALQLFLSFPSPLPNSTCDVVGVMHGMCQARTDILSIRSFMCLFNLIKEIAQSVSKRTVGNDKL